MSCLSQHVPKGSHDHLLQEVQFCCIHMAHKDSFDERVAEVSCFSESERQASSVFGMCLGGIALLTMVGETFLVSHEGILHIEGFGS